MIKNTSFDLREGGANYRVKWQSHFSVLRAPRALNTENTVYDITNNVTMSDDEVVASYVPPRYLFPLSASFLLLLEENSSKGKSY